MPDHPTNTCDPLTGNWAERLMNPFQLREVLEKGGFHVEILPGYWDDLENTLLKRIAKCTANLGLSVLKHKGLFFSPYYVICGFSSTKFSVKNVFRQ
jgi:hypothetical protein